MKILSSAQIRDVERRSIDEYFLTEDILMENAAHGICRVIKDSYLEYNVVILCGPGNNGGDGLALGRLLYNKGFNITLYITDDTHYKSASLRNYKAAKALNIVTDSIPTLLERTLVVDALFGIGLNRNIDDKLSELIETINSSKSKVLSIDIPSGVNGDSGKVMGCAIKADLTITFISAKMGHFIFPGADYTGELVVDKISIPRKLLDLVESPEINGKLKFLNKNRNIHKSSYGKILTIAGSSSYYGAPYFASKATLLSGAGYSTLISEENVIKNCAILAPEVIYRSENELSNELNSSTCVIFGPGIGLNSRSRELFNTIIKKNPRNLIIDGDGITLLSENRGITKTLKNIFVITPHPKELSLLMDTTVSEIESDRVFYAKEASKKLNCIVVLKGVYTVITSPNGEVYINTNSSRTLATAGSGDILCGIIGGLTGYTDLILAVRAGVFIHGTCGILAENKIGQFGVTSSDIMKFIPESINSYTSL